MIFSKNRRCLRCLFVSLSAFTLPVVSLPVVTTTMALAADSAKTPFADVEVKISDAQLAKKGASIRTLYITLYDAAGKTPMPYGAIKIALDSAPTKGTLYKGQLDANNVMVMGSGKTPAKLRIKARLDKDGSAGPDASGDLLGSVNDVTPGSKVVVVIDKAID